MKLLEQWKILREFQKQSPVNLPALCRALSVDLRHSALDANISGMLEIINGNPVVTLNQDDPETRRRFTLAHELGHLMLHRGLIGDGLDDDRAYRSTDHGKYHNTAIGKSEEIEANRFAANLLMPHSEVRRIKAEGKTTAEMAEIFKVSVHSMSIRLGEPYVG